MPVRGVRKMINLKGNTHYGKPTFDEFLDRPVTSCAYSTLKSIVLHAESCCAELICGLPSSK
jgi:hypothetical protein